MVVICWYDLTEEKQEEILEVFGNNQNFDVIPIAILPDPKKEEVPYLS